MIIPRDKKKNIFYTAIIVAGLLFYLYYGFYKILCSGLDISGKDFTRGCFAARNFLNGLPLYSMPSTWNPFFYFPPVAFIYVPFAKMPDTAAKILWLLLGHVITGLCFWTLYGYGKKNGKLLSAAAAALVIAFSTPLYQTLFNGNINILIFFGLSLSYSGLLVGRTGFIPVVIAFFSVIKVFPAVLMGIFVRRRNYVCCGYFLLTLLITAVVSLSVFGLENNRTWFHQLPGMTRFVGFFHAMSLTFIIKLFCPGISVRALGFFNLAFLCALTAVWWKVSGQNSGEVSGPGRGMTDLFALTVILVLTLPSSWDIYPALFIMPFYFVVFSLLEGKNDFKFIWVFLLAFLLMNLWEIIYYHLPLAPGHFTIGQIELEKDLHPFLYRLIFSLHFSASLALLGWVFVNYRALADNIERIAPVNSGRPATKAA